MTNAQKAIINQNIQLFELIYDCQENRDQNFFKAEMTEAILIAICSLQALQRSLERAEVRNNIINLPTSRN